ncbi:mannose-6-phosphate isomerase, class I [Vibrio nomapromontoriensis]|uniref:mannose-6-phosphate isomerase, class I n=1 Tax=Vibrio nomapromontoriensis TaxID=2910246 RepID=UPI003D0D4ABF
MIRLKSDFYPMENVINTYSWGSYTSIEEIFGIKNQDNQPQAELWMGAHPNGCSKVKTEDGTVFLSDFISDDATNILSPETEQTYGELPFLFKVLAAEHPLSIQVHPNKRDAEIGFKKEEKADIPLTAAYRNYKDSNHKPELIYALTPFKAMNGFRRLDEISSLLSLIDSVVVNGLLKKCSGGTESAFLKSVFTGLLSLEGKDRVAAITSLTKYAKAHSTLSPFDLITKLVAQYPSDIGIFSPLLLNVITLEPGEAMYLDARTPHAYIGGTGLEIMASSDNVLRAGLTSKYIDIEELVKCTDFVSKNLNTLILQPTFKHGEMVYPVPVLDFKFSILLTSENREIHVASAEILLALDHDMIITKGEESAITITKGSSVFIPAYVNRYTVSSVGRIARATSSGN